MKLLVGLQFLVALAVLALSVLALGFVSEAHRNVPLPVLVVWAVVLCPLGLAVRLLFLRTKASTLTTWAPTLAAVVALPLAFALVRGMEHGRHDAREARRAAETAELREKAQAGSPELLCRLVALDPGAPPELHDACFARLEALDPESRWREMADLVDDLHFARTRPDGPTAIPARHQVRFLELYFQDWMARPDFLATRYDRLRLSSLSLDARRIFTEEAQAHFQQGIQPELIRRLEGENAPPEPPGEDLHGLTNRELAEQLRSTP